MKNVINITACDNQLTIVAVSSNEQTIYQIARVGSGPAVDVSIALEKGTFDEPNPIINPLQPVQTVVHLPADTYSIYYTGINAGGPYSFLFTLNGETFKLLNGQAAAKYGYVWNHGGPEPSTIKVTID